MLQCIYSRTARRSKMRAHRLITILMLLQARGCVTAHKLAEELEVSVRTIYRDMDALSAAGIPVYAERGPGGGCALLDSYRTTLTGLTPNEVRALFMLSIPAPLAELGVDQELKVALLKLAAALPATRRHEEEQARLRIHLDPVSWDERREPVPHLQTIQQAIWQDRRLWITYRLPFEAQAERLVEPYGLVAKASTWYLVCARADQVRVYRVSRVLEARVSDTGFEYPLDFDLASFWQAWCVEVEERRLLYPVTVRATPQIIPWLRQRLGDGLSTETARSEAGDADGWLRLTLSFESLEEARRYILGFGRAIEVLSPRALQSSVLDYATQIVDLYTG
jgi:predicted DNA-binding transcriptional regulator YafY